MAPTFTWTATGTNRIIFKISLPLGSEFDIDWGDGTPNDTVTGPVTEATYSHKSAAGAQTVTFVASPAPLSLEDWDDITYLSVDLNTWVSGIGCSFTDIATITALETLLISDAGTISGNLSELTALTNLTSITITRVEGDGPTGDIADIVSMTQLETIRFYTCPNIECNIHDLRPLTNLADLRLTGTTDATYSRQGDLASSYVYEDYGAGFWDGDFEFRVKVNCSSADTSGGCTIWAVTNTVGAPCQELDNGEQGLAITMAKSSAGGATLGLLFHGKGTQDDSVTYDLAASTDYYVKIRRDESVGTYGKLYVDIFTDADYSVRHTGVSAYTFTLTGAKYAFRYLYAAGSYNVTMGVPKWSGVISNLTLSALTIDEIYHFKKDSPSAESHLLAHAVLAPNMGGIFDNTGDIPDPEDFQTELVWRDRTSADSPRFSDAPGGNVAYCCETDTCLWPGDEALLAGLYLVDIPETERNDIALNDNGASADTIVTTAGNFFNDGFRAGMKFSISGANTAANDILGTIQTISADGKTLSIATGSFNGTDAAGASTVTISADKKHIHNPINVTGQGNDLLPGGVVALGQKTDAASKMLLHCDGTEGSATFTDSVAGSTLTVAPQGSCVITKDAKFGSGAANMPTSTGYIRASSAVADFWDMGSDPFTIDMWVQFNDIETATARGIWRLFDSVTHAPDECMVDCVAYPHKVVFKMVHPVGGANLEISANIPRGLKNNRWYHIAVIRGWGGVANDFAITVWDGVEQHIGTGTATGTGIERSAYFYVGRGQIGATLYVFRGKFDEVRVHYGKAWWTKEFVPPSRPYNTEQPRYLLVQTLLPAKEFKIYLQDPNTVTSSLTGYFWTGKDMWPLSNTSDGTADGGVALAKDGTFSFSDTEKIAKPFFFQDSFLYSYLLYLDDGGADIFRMTAGCSFQRLKDLWDGVYRQIVKFMVYRVSSAIYDDYTLAINYESASSVPIGAEIGALASGGHIIFMSQDRLAGAYFTIVSDKGNENAITMTVSYHNGEEFVSVDGLIDGTLADRASQTLSRSGMVSWTPVSSKEEVAVTLFGMTGYAYKIEFSGVTSGTYSDDVQIDLVYGLPTQHEIPPFKFSHRFGNQLHLAGYTKGGLGNRVDFSMGNTAQVFNGDLSSDGGYQSLYIGGGQDLTCAATLYNRYGSNLISGALYFKNHETYMVTGSGVDDMRVYPISDKIGCPAPRTLASAEMGYEVAEDVQRNIVLFLSNQGPMIMDGTILKPIPGVEKFFKHEDSECVNYSNIANSVGWFDALRREYNLLIPSGASQEKCNLWLVYDLIRRRWFKMQPTTYPQCATAAIDALGTRYGYIGTHNGHVMRTDSGNTWAGNDIEHTWETGDFYPSSSSWDETHLRKLKFIAAKTSASTDVDILFYEDTSEANVTVTGVGNDIRFRSTAVDGENCIESLASVDFRALGFHNGQKILVSGASPAGNNGEMTIDYVSQGGNKLFISDVTLTSQGTGNPTVALVCDSRVSLSSGTGRVTRQTVNLNRLAWAFRMKFSADTNTTGQTLRPISVGLLARRVRIDE